jgi:hypothetical protein
VFQAFWRTRPASAKPNSGHYSSLMAGA